MALVEARNVSKVYRRGTAAPVHALAGVSITVAPGSFTLLTGPSGSGKTTLLALLGALERPTSGDVFWRGRNLSDCSDAELARLRRQLGFVFQDFSLIAGLTVWENVAYPLIPRGVSRGERRARAQEVLTALGLGDRQSARPRQLSGGEQQRVAVARALVSRPEFLLADEPTSNLDPESAHGVAELLVQIHAAGTTVIVSSHDPSFAPRATHTSALRNGVLANSQ